MSRVARLGAFIVVTLAILAAGVFIIGSKAYLFRHTYQLKAEFDNVAGLDAGASVEVGGVHSGTVDSIQLPHRPGGKVTVIMNLDRSTHEIIKLDSVASIETEGVLGSQYLAISFGSAGEPDVHNGDVLQSKPPLEVSQLLMKTSAILDSSQQAILNATQATAHLNSVSAKIDSGQGSVGALINDRALYSNLQRSTDSLSGTMVQAQAGVTDFRENMEALKHNFLLSGYFKKRGYEDSASLEANEVDRVPAGAPDKTFTYSPKQLFDGRESTKLRNQKSLNDSGEFLAANQFGCAVVVVSAGAEGDTQKELVLTQARAMFIREYLVEHYGFDDSKFKTMGTGKQSTATPETEWGTIQLLVFPGGCEMPANMKAPAGTASKTAPVAPAHGPDTIEPKP
jgi:phospholipid/cholesterol/gamma-HCH transport system substrate-binding protein